MPIVYWGICPNAEDGAFTEIRQSNGIREISISGYIELSLRQGENDSMIVSAANKKYIPNLKTEIADGKLTIYYAKKPWEGLMFSDNFLKSKKLKVVVTIKELNQLRAMAGSIVRFSGVINASNLFLNVNSGSFLKGEIETENLTVSQGGGSAIYLSGKAEEVFIRSNSGALFSSYHLSTEKCQAWAGSGGKINITVNSAFSATARSGGRILYQGSCSSLKFITSSGGLIKKNQI